MTKGRSSGRPFFLRSESAENRTVRARHAMACVRLCERLDHDRAQPSDSVQHAMAIEDEAGVAVPGTFPGIQPDHQVAAPRLTGRHGPSEFCLLVRIARCRATAGIERLLYKTAAIRTQR